MCSLVWVLISVPGATEQYWVSFDGKAGWERLCSSSCGIFLSSLAPASPCLPEALQGVQHSAWELLLLFSYRALPKDNLRPGAQWSHWGIETKLLWRDQVLPTGGKHYSIDTLPHCSSISLAMNSLQLHTPWSTGPKAQVYDLSGPITPHWSLDFSMCWKTAQLFVFPNMALGVSFLPQKWYRVICIHFVIVSKFVYLDYISVFTLSALEYTRCSCSSHNLCAMGLFLPEMKPVLNIAL